MADAPGKPPGGGNSGKAPPHLHAFKWAKGQSGNPKGRPRSLAREFRQMLKTLPRDADGNPIAKGPDGAPLTYYQALFQATFRAAVDRNNPRQAEMAKILWVYALGRPTEDAGAVADDEDMAAPEAAEGPDVEGLTTDELRKLLEQTRRSEAVELFVVKDEGPLPAESVAAHGGKP